MGLVSVNPKYTPTRETYDSVDEFLVMCKVAFGAINVPQLEHQPCNNRWIDEGGDTVLIETSE